MGIYLNKTEMMILSALANGAKMENYKHFAKALHNLHELGYVHCFFDEQNKVITGHITLRGKEVIEN